MYPNLDWLQYVYKQTMKNKEEANCNSGVIVSLNGIYIELSSLWIIFFLSKRHNLKKMYLAGIACIRVNDIQSNQKMVELSHLLCVSVQKMSSFQWDLIWWQNCGAIENVLNGVTFPVPSAYYVTCQRILWWCSKVYSLTTHEKKNEITTEPARSQRVVSRRANRFTRNMLEIVIRHK